MSATHSTGPTRPELTAVAVGGAVGAAVTYSVQLHGDDTGAGAAAVPLLTIVLAGVGCLLMGALLGGVGDLLPRTVRALLIGTAGGITPLATYAAVGLTVRSGTASAVFLIGTPLVALVAGTGGYFAASLVTRRGAAQHSEPGETPA
ncbi:Camphor resistance protein CrcB OS=Tsukamurella paurometabola (strain ATCC 8368 / DSM / CCUG 35730 / CIP 100753 / JCM 10117 / KCTC 9821 / NBRC 16120 / NCIMB 702349 / NCTC 13040) OX=521096 GN=Tpau_0051 PE=4 SV=1 [Tsukamurella paurometabola]|uniref:Camphor resistance protein CrcB n=1 Tax=Tsukamurella paurometabola (strain ATCC 8368 / DSM 20162 / CCUG 35730 / CIP 100753 / JCM 10117 / KCTC 9821 / NBRC 16120 / NCIMB 702349 / NCTC 13040) TaxID=521096 RepID=D5UPT7_TSUPD|nr:hypothetical protein [Tsukamurella paurometabola]ADG76705.1 camphor resistance protein CrcB [Tsukamurella paurometabola DSM 20162]SUP41294.1 Uncharacterised protein [Tsukamurella paurometabola]